jgi:hypothetical protein
LKDTPNTTEQVNEPDNKNLENEVPTHRENYQLLIHKLRTDDKADTKLKRFMINAIYRKALPDRRRTKVQISDFPCKIVVDSNSKCCFVCGNKSHYIVYNMIGLPKFGWRLCWKHLDYRARQAISDYYETQ